MRLSLFRKWIQALTFSAFLVLFFMLAYPFPLFVPVTFFLRLDPLVALVSMVAGRAIIFTMALSLIVLLSGLLFGRFFCGYVCPLGTMIDAADRLLFRGIKRPENASPKQGRRVKYFILIGVVAASVLGVNLLGYFSPMAIAPRVWALGFFSPVVAMLNGLIDLTRPLFVRLGFTSFIQLSFPPVYFNGALAAVALFVFIITMSYFRERFWCRYICPTGAMISLVSRFAPLKRSVSRDSCTTCRLCARSCPMRAIDDTDATTILSECTLCGNCLDACNRQSVSIGFSGFGPAGGHSSVNVPRRAFLYSSAAGLVGAATIKAGLHNDRNMSARLIRPPGSLPEPDFLARCIRCGACMKVCQTNGLQPTMLESGVGGIFTPRLMPRRGPCEEKCNMCGQVCPTGAIRNLPLEEKRFVKIGTAVIDRRRCIAWEQNRLCLICDEVCPYDAIFYKIVTTFTGPFKRPFVNESKCTGCGLCELKCPVGGEAAIRAFSIGEERKDHGSYITEAKKRMRSVSHDLEELQYDAGDIGSGGQMHETEKPGVQTGPTPAPSSTGNEALPAGFITE